MTPARRPLAVVLYGRHVADVVDAGDGYTAVRYTDAAVAEPAGARLSLSLPVRAEAYPGAGVASRWVRSLLPEGRALAWAVQAYGVPEDDRFGLLAALGADVAGAARIVAKPEDAGEGSYLHLSTEDVASVVRRAPEHGLALDPERGVRLSLAGLQDKVALHRIDDDYCLPVDGAPSSLVLKPEPAARAGVDLTGLATNELFCLTLARSAGLDAAAAAVVPFGGIRTLVVERFDRVHAGDRLERLHQEDVLSAMGLDPWLKYEAPHVRRVVPAGGFADAGAVTATPGPSLRAIAAFLARQIGRANVLPFLDAVTFNVAIGNADSHARNYSLLLPPNGDVRLTPLYDLICTRLYPALDAEAAQRVNGKWDLDAIVVADLVAEAATWTLPPGVAEQRIRRVLAAVVDSLGRATEACVRGGGDPDVAEEVATVVAARVRRM
jgi:serine/threonine-protein kinase HipA